VLVPRHAPPDVYAGMAELIEDHGGGLTYDRTSPDALAACMNRIVRDAPLREQLETEARRVTSLRHGWRDVVRHVLAACPVRPLRSVFPRAERVAATPQPAQLEAGAE
jgi:hypothetical protein